MTPPLTQDQAQWVLRLYVAGKTPKSLMASSNLKIICEELAGRCRFEIIDLIERPEFAREDQIVAIPTLVRRAPPPIRKVIGDLSNKERVLASLELQPARARE